MLKWLQDLGGELSERINVDYELNNRRAKLLTVSCSIQPEGGSSNSFSSHIHISRSDRMPRMEGSLVIAELVRDRLYTISAFCFSFYLNVFSFFIF